MSTRAGIIVKDADREIHFYQHSDGYPEATLPTLNRFLDLVKSGKIRDNAPQAAGWLILIGHAEMRDYCLSLDELEGGIKRDPNFYLNWKVGTIEPTTNVNDHGDLEYVYTIDLETKTITVRQL